MTRKEQNSEKHSLLIQLDYLWKNPSLSDEQREEILHSLRELVEKTKNQ